jgi:DNA-binding NarL/FixJ family response regulator
MTDSPPEEIRVFITDDHAVVRRGIASFLSACGDIEIVGEASDGLEAIDRLAVMATHEGLPDVLLLDLVMPKLNGVDTAARVVERFPSVKIVVLTSYSEMERVHAALANGAAGYLLKDADPSEVEAAVRAAARNEVFLDTAIARQLTQQFVAPNEGVTTLSAREKDVLTLVGKGMSNRAIAKELTISERTARTHVSNVLSKLHLDSRTQAALIAVKEGLVEP